VLKPPVLAAACLLIGAAPAFTAVQSRDSGRERRHFPLHCRGGDRLVFDTLGPIADTGTTARVSLRFTAGPRAAGQNGEGLEPSTCAWVDRPLNGAEPLRVRVTLASGDSTPRLTLRDTSLYWSFLAYNTDSGHFHGVGYRYWKADDAVAAQPAPAPPATPGRWSFDVRHFPLYIIGWVLISWIPLTMLLGVWSGWRRLAALYPSRPIHGGRRFRCGLIMRIAHYRSGARLTADDSHLHFSLVPPFRPGHPPFSVPWADVCVSRDEWPWFPLKGVPVMRLTLARDRGIRILVQVSVGEGIIAASGGRLKLSQPAAPAASGQLVRK
jgi:hypothetical protein